MKLFSDIFSDDELFTDAYPTELKNDCYYEVEGKVISVDGGVDESLIGGNASAEGGGDDADDVAETGKFRSVCSFLILYKFPPLGGPPSDHVNSLRNE